MQKLRWIPPGEFLMGSPDSEPERDSDETQHTVVISQGYWLADTACSQGLWRAVMGENPSLFIGDDLPVEQISWHAVQQFCSALQASVPDAVAKLPSEAQWEYACRAGTNTAFWWGDELPTGRANYDGNYPYAGGATDKYRKTTVAVREFERNPWGLYQVHGNVWEWCDDSPRRYGTERVVDPHGGQGGERALRGGRWNGNGQWLCSARRNAGTPDLRGHFIGFRFAVVSVPSAAGPKDLEKQSSGLAPTHTASTPTTQIKTRHLFNQSAGFGFHRDAG